MKRQIVLYSAAVVVLTVAGQIFAQAQPAQPARQGHNTQQEQTRAGPEGMRSHRFEARRRMMAALNLTPEQKTMAKSIFGQAAKRPNRCGSTGRIAKRWEPR